MQKYKKKLKLQSFFNKMFMYLQKIVYLCKVKVAKTSVLINFKNKIKEYEKD